MDRAGQLDDFLLRGSDHVEILHNRIALTNSRCAYRHSGLQQQFQAEESTFALGSLLKLESHHLPPKIGMIRTKCPKSDLLYNLGLESEHWRR